MGWWAVAAAAVPYVVGAFQKKPDAPQYKRKDIGPQRDAYYRAMVDTAFNPSSREFQMSSEVVQDQVNRALAGHGLAGSGIGVASLANAQASMANEFMRNQQAERMKAVQAMTGYDMDKLRMSEDVARAQYERDMGAYNDALRRQAGVAQGIGAVVGAYAQSAERDETRDWYQKMMNSGAGNSAAKVVQAQAPINTSLPYQSSMFGNFGTYPQQVIAPPMAQPSYFGYNPYGSYPTPGF